MVADSRTIEMHWSSQTATVSTENLPVLQCNGGDGPTASTNATVEAVPMVAAAYDCT